MKISNIPLYRFIGYTDAWELRKLGEFGKATSGISIESEFNETGKYKVISIGSYSETSKYTDQGIRAAKTEKTEKRILNKNDLTMILNDKTASGNIIGRVLLIDADDTYVYNQRTERIEVYENEYLPEFLYQLLNSDNIRSKIIRASQGNTQIYVNWSSISELVYVIPESKEEQAKIAEYFSNLDNLITLHQRKLDMLKEQKKTYLKLLFPAKGQTKPALRFQGFEDDWEEVKLGDVGETFTGLSGKTKEDFGHGEGKFITYVNVFNNPISDLLGTDKIEVDESQTSVQFGDIFFTTSSETPEEVGMSSVWLGDGDNIYLNSFCFGFRPTLKLSNHFMAYVLRSTVIRKKFIFLAQGISRYNISKTKVMNISIPLPTLPEQEAIGTFFQTLDQEIAQVEDKLASLKEMKKTLLRKLFVSWGMRSYHALPMSRSPSGAFLDCLSSQAVRREFF